MGRIAKKARTSTASVVQTIDDTKIASKLAPTTDDSSESESVDEFVEQYTRPERIDVLGNVSEAIAPILDDPARFYAPNHDLYKEIANQAQSLYSFTLRSNQGYLTARERSSILPNLLIDTFTPEQVWSQVQLLHNPVVTRSRIRIAKLARIQPSDLGLSLVEEGASDEEGEMEDSDALSMDDEAEDDIEQVDDEQLDGEDDDADLEARIDELDEDEEDDDENELIDDDEDAEEEQDDDDSSVKPSSSKSKKSSEPRDITEDSFFNLNDMDRFADHFEAIDSGLEPPTKSKKSQPKRKRDEDEDEDEEDEDDELDEEVFGDVDLTEDVGDLDMGEGETYDDFFDEPTENELHGQTVQEMHQQEEDEDEGEEDEDAEMMEEDEDDAIQADKNADADDEFSGYFARMSATQREAEAKKVEDGELAKLSKFERERRLAAPAIAELERRLVDPKTWAQRGEITAIDRPKDSLLEADVEIEYAGKPTEVMTASVNQSIEDVIKKRVESQNFDDPKRKAAPKPRQQRVHDEVEVSAEKNELGLADIYAQAYLESQASANASVDANGNPTAVKTKAMQELEMAHREIHSIFIGLCSELDALSQYEFTPIHRVDMKIVRNEASGDLLQREEVGLDFEQTGLSMAASEVAHGKAIKQRDMAGEAEKTSDERQRQRRARKAVSRTKKGAKADQLAMTQLSAVDQAIANKAASVSAKNGELQGKWTSAQLQAATKARNVKQGTTSSAPDSQPKSSKAFFAQLQATVNQVEQDAVKQGYKM